MSSRAVAAAVAVSALAASLAGCMSVSDPEKPRPSGSTARHDGRDGLSGPGGVTVDGRGGGARRMGHNGAGHPADGDDKVEKSSGSAKPTPSEPGTPSQPVQPSGPEPGAGGAHGGSDGHGRPGHPKPTPSRPDHPVTPPASPPPSTPPAQPTPPPSNPPPPSSQASGPSPVAPMSPSSSYLYEDDA
ncbi:hypothetical protein ACGFWI_31055 [Streptomyces sp. NPDC048434]|uniref:hypothetical protein n=1 Tax=Streptomyces sp. NPDC048434 TaxID=3365549 RepID=UPI0037125A8A